MKTETRILFNGETEIVRVELPYYTTEHQWEQVYTAYEGYTHFEILNEPQE